jgi:hypothetical protein
MNGISTGFNRARISRLTPQVANVPEGQTQSSSAQQVSIVEPT